MLARAEAPPRAQVRRLAMYSKKAKRDKNGKIIHQEYQSSDLPNSRIQPDRRWFGNTRVIGQKQLESFREQMSTKVGAIAVLVQKSNGQRNRARWGMQDLAQTEERGTRVRLPLVAHLLSYERQVAR